MAPAWARSARYAAVALCLASTSAAAADILPGDFGARWEAAWNARLTDAAVALYAPDAVFVHATGARVAGQGAIAALFRQTLAANTPHIAIIRRTTGQAGDAAWESGTYAETIVPMKGASATGGSARNIAGGYLLLLARSPGGAWLIQRQVWSQDE